MIHGDITKISSDDIPDGADVIIGGFPCQGFSVANTKRSMEDKRNFLYKEMLRIIKDKKPKFFVAENVKGLLSMEKGKVIEMIKSDFESLGYRVDARVLNAAEYGVPQARERVVIIGNNIGVENPYPVVTHYIEGTSKDTEGLLPAVTTEQAIGFLENRKLTKNKIVISRDELEQHIREKNIQDREGFYSILGVDPNCEEIIIKTILLLKMLRRHFGVESMKSTSMTYVII